MSRQKPDFVRFLQKIVTKSAIWHPHQPSSGMTSSLLVWIL